MHLAEQLNGVTDLFVDCDPRDRSFKCSPVGWSQEQAQAAAQARLINREESRVEQALWTGDLDNTPNLAQSLAPYPAPTPIGSFQSVTRAIAALERHMAYEYGSLGVIHMCREYALIGLEQGSLTTSGGRLLTALQTPVVAGSGYAPGSIRLSPALFGYRSDIFTSTLVDGDNFDPRRNEMYGLAERTYLIGFDSCGLATAEIELV